MRGMILHLLPWTQSEASRRQQRHQPAGVMEEVGVGLTSMTESYILVALIGPDLAVSNPSPQVWDTEPN